MKFIKQTALIIAAVAVLISLFAGCKSNRQQTSAQNSDTDKISIISTIFPPYDFAREITKGKAEVSMLLSPGMESHSYEPTPQDIIKIQNCDIFIYVGGESDDWVNTILESVDTSKIKILTLMDCVEPVEEEVVEGMQEENEDHEEDGEGHEEEYDEHVWTSPSNAKLIVQKLSQAICQVDSANKDAYEENTLNYIKKLNSLDSDFKEVIQKAKRKTIIFGDRFPFRYFADAYGLKYYAAFPGCSTETEASASTISFLIDKVKSEKIPVVFHVELSNKKIANAISESTGAKVLLLNACHNISKDDFNAGKTYIDLMSNNVGALKEALN